MRGRPAVPLEPVGAILKAFRSHDIVALDEGDHGNEQGHAFRLSLVRHPEFAATVNDIVVEFGNALYQDVIDRFVRGDNVSTVSLRRVWQNTTQPHFAVDLPIYEEFFRAVRAVTSRCQPTAVFAFSWAIRQSIGTLCTPLKITPNG